MQLQTLHSKCGVPALTTNLAKSLATISYSYRTGATTPERLCDSDITVARSTIRFAQPMDAASELEEHVPKRSSGEGRDRVEIIPGAVQQSETAHFLEPSLTDECHGAKSPKLVVAGELSGDLSPWVCSSHSPGSAKVTSSREVREGSRRLPRHHGSTMK